MAGLGMGVAVRQIHQLFSFGTVGNLPDSQLLDRFADEPEGEAFAVLAERHGPMVLGVCRSILEDEHDAEDAFQATFLVLARKARSIRAGESLAAWLCRVAFRIGVRADRERDRRRRGEAGAMMRASQRGRVTDPEVVRALHEELDRLPESLRVPVVLCHLEGRTYEEAARMLRVPAPTIRGRLARARVRLAARLTRRGMSIAVVAATLASRAAKASVPSALAQAAIRGATGGAGSASAALASGLLGTMAASKAMAWAAGMAIVAGLCWTASAVQPTTEAHRPSRRPLPPLAPPRLLRTETRPMPAASAPRPDDVLEIAGRVVGPDGRPVARASVKTAFSTRGRHEPSETTGDADGRFRLKVPGSTRDLILRGRRDRRPSLTASAPGFGLASSEIDLREPGEATIRLPAAGPPIGGRILDLEGRPVAGARIKAVRMWTGGGGDLSSWASRLKAGEARGIYQGLDVLVGEAETTSGPDGRFRLEGIGPERVVDLVVSGPTIATERLVATNHAGPELRHVGEGFRGPETTVVRPPGFAIAAAPTRIVEGVVRDKETGRPIAGVNVQGAVYDDRSLIPNPDVSVLTDAEGRYRLSGLPRSSAYRLFVYPGPGLPYARATLRAAADTPASEPVAFDISLKRGVMVKGRLLDKGTGEPVRIEMVNVSSFADNPNVAEYPGYKDGGMPFGIPDDEGGFEVVALPGRGLLGVRAEHHAYLKPRGLDKIAGYDAERGTFAGVVPDMHLVVNYHALVETNFAPDTETATLDLVADPGRKVKMSVVDPEGRPLGGTTVNGAEGLLGASQGSDHASPEIEVKSLTPEEPRRVTVRHVGRKLVGSVVLKGDEPGPVTLELRPWAEIKGRIVDDDGMPRPRLALSAGGRSHRPLEELAVLPGGDVGGGIALDAGGRFHVVGLVPGVYYGADAVERGYLHIGRLFDELRLGPGEVKPLGDLKVIPLKEDDDS